MASAALNSEGSLSGKLLRQPQVLALVSAGAQKGNVEIIIGVESASIGAAVWTADLFMWNQNEFIGADWEKSVTKSHSRVN